jgi:cytidylate kinase
MSVITISRQYSSGGDEIAHRVCALLQYRYFDRRLIAEVAAETSLATGGPIDFSEDQYRMRGFLDRLLDRKPQQPIEAAGTWVETKEGVRTRETVKVAPELAIEMERAAIQAAYEQGRLVIVGRGGQVILRGKPGVLHVRIEAPLESRIERLRAAGQYTQAAAKQVILEHDQAAADYVKSFYGLNWADPLLYHLTINCDLWGVAPAAQLIVTAVECLQTAEESQEAGGNSPAGE